MTRVTSNLWFAEDVRNAVDFYTATIPDSAITGSTVIPTGPSDNVIVIEFTLADQLFVAMQAGRLDPFNHAFSISVELDTQAEIDRIWNAFLDNGGTAEQCGWLRDRWGVSWQIVPRRLIEMTASPDRAAAKRAIDVMLTMVKLDLARLEAAFAGKA